MRFTKSIWRYLREEHIRIKVYIYPINLIAPVYYAQVKGGVE